MSYLDFDATGVNGRYQTNSDGSWTNLNNGLVLEKISGLSFLAGDRWAITNPLEETSIVLVELDADSGPFPVSQNWVFYDTSEFTDDPFGTPVSCSLFSDTKSFW